MIVYRLCARKYKDDLSGYGAEKYGGRWNNIGLPLIYTCEHQSLCVLEMAVHMPLALMKNMELVMISIEIPDAEENILRPKGLPYDWKQVPHNNISQDFGDEFILMQKGLAMKVPSIIVEKESNILINPRHKLASKVKVVNEQKFSLDKRLFN